MNIGIYGGSFNPVHKGHIKLAEYVISELSLDRLFVIPAYVSPFKNERQVPVQDVINMCRLAFRNEKTEILTLEAERKGKSYTVDTLNEIIKLCGDNNYSLIVGSDQFVKFNKWYCFEEILSKAELCTVSRDFNNGIEELKEFAEKNISPFGKYRICDFSPLEISSSEIREKLCKGEDVSEFLSEEVLRYIKDRGLYK